MESKELELLARAKRLAKVRDPGEYVLKRDCRVRVEPGLKKVVIDSSVVKGETEPLLVFEKSSQDKQA